MDKEIRLLYASQARYQRDYEKSANKDNLNLKVWY